MKFRKLFSILIVVVLYISLTSCGENKETKNDTAKEMKKDTVVNINLNTQEGYVKIIKDLGITIFDGAIFNEVRKSDFYGNNIIEYSLPVGEGLLFSNAKLAEDSLISFYKNELETILIPKGWMRSQGGDKNKMMYIKPGTKVKMFSVSILKTIKDDINQPKKFLFNFSE
ncbi:MAG: hypothetical protein PF638_05555 [Candidatus Delongbacteria bacterium]|jgi:hypothetical protein|nr:hypothetical protein [Candidatus Delongbacteria bacterium]